ncbi:porin [Cellvibrio zantedeschiae]|uniref:Porin n=1 Tax=Cellvibrio zantedeschiae TaxID=1237077 RepID=A0ABQ3AS64_9GAMM|nr:porin [Cellvibrio zantedeschiae]GGY65632.1 porin [Cellvibrio zantedeschiae]
MKKALLPLMIASLVPAAAFADVTVYGKANVAFQSTDKNVGGEFTEVVSNASRIGLKGTESINDDLKVIYQFEYQTKVDDGSNSLSSTPSCSATSKSTTATPTATTTTTTTCTISGGGQTFSQRNIYVGLKGSGGTAMIGMFDTPFKVAQEKVDLFNDYIGDIQAVLQGETRAKNIIQYSTPTFSDITVNVAYVNAEKDAVNVDDGYSASIVYSTKNVYLALANDSNVTNASGAVVHTTDTDILRAVGRFNVGPVVLGAIWETYDNGVIDEDGFMVSAQWNVNDKWALKAQHAASDMIQLGGEQTSIGADYKLSKAAKVFGYYTQIEDERLNATTKLVDNAARADDKYLAVGIELNF